MKKVILAILAVFIAWSVMDFLIHGVILHASYAATASLWRPMSEMKTPPPVLIGVCRFAHVRFNLFPFFLTKKHFHRVDLRVIVWLEHWSAHGIRELFGNAHSVPHGVRLVFRVGC